MSKAGEQWRFGIEPGEIASFVAAYGFQASDHKGAQELEATYFQDADAQLVGRINGTHCIVKAVGVEVAQVAAADVAVENPFTAGPDFESSR